MKSEQDSTNSIKLCADLIYSRIYLAFIGRQVVLLVLEEMEISSIPSGSCLVTPSHRCVHTILPVYVETLVNEEWLLFGQHFSTADIRYPILMLLASKLTAVDEKDKCIFSKVGMDCLFFLVVQLLPRKGMGLELKDGGVNHIC